MKIWHLNWDCNYPRPLLRPLQPLLPRPPPWPSWSDLSVASFTKRTGSELGMARTRQYSICLYLHYTLHILRHSGQCNLFARTARTASHPPPPQHPTYLNPVSIATPGDPLFRIKENFTTRSRFRSRNSNWKRNKKKQRHKLWLPFTSIMIRKPFSVSIH